MRIGFTQVSVVLAVLFCFSPFSVRGQPNTLQILSWNVQLLPAIVFYKGQKKRALLIVNQLKDAPYDIIVFHFVPRTITQFGHRMDTNMDTND